MKAYSYESVDSTNSEARRFAESIDLEAQLSEIQLGVVFISKAQTEGRGQHGKSWLSEEGGLYYSLLVEGALFRENDPHYYVYGVGHVVSDFLDDLTGLPVRLEYPNDVYIADKKVGGILIEFCQCQGRPFAIVGIGINVNQTYFSDSLYLLATSLFLASGKTWDLESIGASLTSRLMNAFQNDDWNTSPPL